VNVKKWGITWALLLVSLLAFSACSIQLDRNPDGSLRAETRLPEATLQSEIRRAINNPQIVDIATELHEGYISVTGEGKKWAGDGANELTFRLTLGAQDGHMTAQISDARLNGDAIDPALVARWNESLTENLAKNNNPNSTLESVRVTPDAVTMVFRIEPKK